MPFAKEHLDAAHAAGAEIKYGWPHSAPVPMPKRARLLVAVLLLSPLALAAWGVSALVG